MKGLSWTVLYNSHFTNNHKTLYEECKELERQGKLKMIKQCDFVKKKKNVNMLLMECDDIYDLITQRYSSLYPWLTKEELIEDIRKNPKLALTSVISFWYYKPWHSITRLDCGVPELKYLINSEKRCPKWTKH